MISLHVNNRSVSQERHSNDEDRGCSLEIFYQHPLLNFKSLKV